MGCRLRCLVPLVVLGLVGACGVDAGREPAGPGDRGSGSFEVQNIEALAIGEGGVVWFLDDDGDELVLARRDESGHVVELGIDRGAAEREPSVGLIAMDGGVVLSRIVCADAACETASLVTEHYASDGDQIVPSGWDASASVTDPGAVTLRSLGSGEVSAQSSATIARIGRDTSEATALPEELASPCYIGQELVAVMYKDSTDESLEPDPTYPSSDAPVRGVLKRFERGEWAEIPGSGFEYPFGEKLEPRCTAHGLEIAQPGQVAERLWDGRDVWTTQQDRPTLDWDVSPQVDATGNLVGGSGGSIVRIDSPTGTRMGAVAVPAHLSERWTDPSQPPGADLIGIGTDASPRAVLCRISGVGSSAARAERCYLFGAQ